MKLELSDVAAGLCACRFLPRRVQRSTASAQARGIEWTNFKMALQTLKPAGAEACRYGTLPPELSGLTLSTHLSAGTMQLSHKWTGIFPRGDVPQVAAGLRACWIGGSKIRENQQAQRHCCYVKPSKHAGLSLTTQLSAVSAS